MNSLRRLNGEVAEARCLRKGRPDLVGVDLDEGFEDNLAKNAGRTYEQLPDGVLVSSGSGVPTNKRRLCCQTCNSWHSCAGHDAPVTLTDG
jgi:hypothetical protein